MPSFEIDATAADNVGVDNVELSLDGNTLGVVNFPPFTWTAPATLTKGPHQLVATATDWWGNTTTSTVKVAYGKVCTNNSDCDADQVCDDQVCVSGPSVAGGLGATCTGNMECESGSCGQLDTTQYCVTSCDPNASGCPDGFDCLASGTSGVCWPSSGGGGCSTTDNSAAPLFLFGLGALLLGRRKSARA